MSGVDIRAVKDFMRYAYLRQAANKRSLGTVAIRTGIESGSNEQTTIRKLSQEVVEGV